MLLTVLNIPDEGLHQEIELPVNTGGDAASDIAHAFLRIFRLGRKVLIEGSVKVSLTLNCGRCLKEFSLPLDMDFREEYNPVEDIEARDEKELKGTELDLGFYAGDEINIDELVREQVFLSVPMSPLCMPECMGICLKCGKDLNEGPCGCRTEETDPRLAPLQKLREAMKDREPS
jgi:uncharacterized protein